MIEKLFASLFSFIGKHIPFIIGVIINLILIWGICKLIDLLQHNIESKLKAKNSDTPLLNLMPVLSKIIKAVIIFILLAGFLQSFGYNVASLIAGFGITGLAVGFAAKEAIVKSFTKYNHDLNSIEILNDDCGKPYVVIQSEIKPEIFVSISYETEYVMAYAVLSSIL